MRACPPYPVILGWAFDTRWCVTKKIRCLPSYVRAFLCKRTTKKWTRFQQQYPYKGSPINVVALVCTQMESLRRLLRFLQTLLQATQPLPQGTKKKKIAIGILASSSFVHITRGISLFLHNGIRPSDVEFRWDFVKCHRKACISLPSFSHHESSRRY